MKPRRALFRVEMLPSGSASKRKLRLVIRIRLEIHESCFPLRDKTVFTEMATAPVEEGDLLTCISLLSRYMCVLYDVGTELEAAASPSLGKRVFGDLRVETYGEQVHSSVSFVYFDLLLLQRQNQWC